MPGIESIGANQNQLYQTIKQSNQFIERMSTQPSLNEGTFSRELLDRQIIQSKQDVKHINDHLQALNRGHKSQLGQADFLRLVTEQLKHQDPLEPMSNENFIAQMAQFSTLEETSKINKGIDNLANAVIGNHSFDLLGKEVTYTVGTFEGAAPMRGTVTAINMQNGSMSLEINGHQVEPSQIMRVETPVRPSDD